ncbi:MAG TPA: radical SAM protein [Kiritimatiellia bacterium]|nr:radical SAM protein [Kiritimatiellia bacterium]
MNAVDLLLLFPNNRPRAYGSLGTDIAAVTPPVQLGLLAAYARQQGLAVELLDADAEGLRPDQVAARVGESVPALVIVGTDQVNSGDVTKMQAAGETVRAIHKLAPGIPVLLDGVVPSAYPERILRDEEADFVCCGESYAPVTALAKWLKANGRDKRPAAGEIPGIWSRAGNDVAAGGRAPMFADVERLPDAAWDLMPPTRYRAHHWHCFDRLNARSPYGAIYTNHGCPYNCSYCSVNVVAGRPNLRLRSADRVLGELETLVEKHGVRNVRILDNVFTANTERVEEICDRIIAKGWDLNFWAYAHVSSIRSPDMLQKLHKAGVRWLAYGFESANARVRGSVNKKTTGDATDRVIGWTRDADISIVGNFIFGLPEDDLGSMQESFDMAKTYQFEWANFYCAMAYPGTRLYDELVAQGVSMPTAWSAYGHYSRDSRPLSTKHVDWKEVVRFRDAAFQEYYEAPAYQAMVAKRFGPEAAAFVRRILEHPIQRDFT